MELKDVIYKLRTDRRLSQKRVAERAGLDPSYISSIEHGRYRFTSPETIERLARGLEVSKEDIYQALSQNSFIIKDAPPKSIQDMSIKEIDRNILEVPVRAELHMPGEIISYAYIPRAQNLSTNLVGVLAKGYCLEPEIHDGDVLIIDRELEPEVGRTILLYHNGHEHPQLIKLKNKKQLLNCEIYGVVVGLSRKL